MGTVGQYLGQKGPVINQHDVSDEYRERYAETFGESPRERWLEEGREDETFEEWWNRMDSEGEPVGRRQILRRGRYAGTVRGCRRAP